MDQINALRKWGRMPLDLAGWDRYSIWGWNAREGSLFAEMWPNDANPDGRPLVALGAPYTGMIGRAEDLALVISERLGCTYREAALAMAECAPQDVASALLSVAA